MVLPTRDHFPSTQNATGLALGAALGLLPLLIYNQLAFGSPFTLGYSVVVGFEGMQQGFFGTLGLVRVVAIAIVGISLSFLWINASYFYWNGGGSARPRDLVAMLPLTCLVLVRWKDRFTR